MTRYRLVVADDHPVVALGIRTALARVSSFELVGEASTGQSAITLCREQRPDVALVDIRLPDIDGPAVVQALRETPPAPKVLFMSGAATDVSLRQLLRDTEESFVLKDSSPDALVQALLTVAGGGRYLDAAVGRLLEAAGEPILSAREIEIVAVLTTGGSNKDIAQQLGISAQTVRTHLANIYEKLGVSDRTEAVTYCLRHKLVEL